MHRRSATRIAAIALGIALVPGVAAAIPVKIPMYCMPAGSGSVTLNVPTKSGKPYELKASFKGLPADTYVFQFACEEGVSSNFAGPAPDGTGKLKFTAPLGYGAMTTCTNPQAVLALGTTVCKSGWVFP